MTSCYLHYIILTQQGSYLTISTECSVKIESFADPACTVNPSPGGQQQNDNSDNGSTVAIVLGVTISVVVLVVALAVVVTIAVLSTRGNQTNQRPRSIHLHQRSSDAGESVISFGSG